MRKSALILPLCLLLCSCDRSPDSCQKSAVMFGTYITVTVYGQEEADLSSAVDAVLEKAAAWEKILSASDPDSELSRLNASALSEPARVSPELWEVLETAETYADLSGGALDCTMGRLIDLWGIGTQQARVPDASEILPLVREAGSSLLLDEDTHTVQFVSPDAQLHLGAVAKGCMADWMGDALMEAGIASGTLSLGGNVLTIGSKPSGEKWTVGIADPRDPREILATVEGSSFSVVTSGGYERYFEQDGVRYHHILDPRTGYPADSGLASVTIIGEHSADCDALSTAVFVMGTEDGMELVESLNGIEAVLVTDTGEILTSSGMEKYNFKQVKP